jgi:hypothetical protein
MAHIIVALQASPTLAGSGDGTGTAVARIPVAAEIKWQTIVICWACGNSYFGRERFCALEL